MKTLDRGDEFSLTQPRTAASSRALRRTLAS